MTDRQISRLRSRVEEKVCDLFDEVLDNIDITDIIDDYDIREAIGDRLIDNLRSTVEDMVSDAVDALF